MNLLDETGAVLDALFSIETGVGDGFRVNWESRGGSDHGPRSSRNKDYAPALELLFERLARNSMRIEQIYIASAKESVRPLDDRKISPKGFSYPISPSPTAVRSLRLAIGRELVQFGQSAGASGGNATKRISLDISWPSHPAALQSELEDALLAVEGAGISDVQRRLRYQPLGDFLNAQTANAITLSISDIEGMVGRLPATAASHQFWANAREHHTSRRSQWLDHGFLAFFEPKNQSVRFSRQLEEEPTDDSQELEHRVKRAVSNLKKRGRHASPPKGNRKPAKSQKTSTAFVRDPNVVAWVLVNAKGICERCEEAAPFNRDDGEPFLEVHHIRPLSEGGPDTTDNALACCPNCHRRLHSGQDRATLKSDLIKRLARIVEHPHQPLT
ncbi:HNH endonuclease [Rhizobium sp. LjRoot254]|uniref:HNH endonuclease n=1 Tax=Rhizobium sp. LjRoot254 TaxID=3342297 RepID=UPI003ECFF756